MSPSSPAKAALRWFGRSLDRLLPAERRVLESAGTHQPIATDINERIRTTESFGDRLADDIARIGGSWSFIVGFGVFLAGWAILNTVILASDAFDPYPFIFLNLVLSMLAAIQAPIIMMSQNRSAARDRVDASHDYEVNLKAEIEIMSLHEKIDEMRGQERGEIRDALLALAERMERVESLMLEHRPIQR